MVPIHPDRGDFAVEKTEAFQELLRELSYYGRVLGRWQSLSRWYGEDVLLYAAEADLLAEIGDRQPVTARELARMKVATPSAISQMVKRLDEKGLLEKQAREDDRRAIGLSLSPGGGRSTAATGPSGRSGCPPGRRPCRTTPRRTSPGPGS